MPQSRPLSELGARIRRARLERGWSLVELAEAAGLSRRFLTETEAGRANPSFLSLAALAAALRRDLAGLLAGLGAARPAGRVALVGLRGAGKTSVGRTLALHLERPFVELDRLIEEQSGLQLAEIFSLHGETYYRDRQREALETALSTMGDAVLAAGGSIVEDVASYARLLETCFTVWLRASPEAHLERVERQGDRRPMARSGRVMEDLRAILERREEAHRRAHLVIDTDGLEIDEVVATIEAALARRADGFQGDDAAATRIA